MPNNRKRELTELKLKPTASPKHKAEFVATVKKDATLIAKIDRLNNLDKQLFQVGPGAPHPSVLSRHHRAFADLSPLQGFASLTTIFGRVSSHRVVVGEISTPP